MYHYSYKEIAELESLDPHKELRLHWEGGEGEAEKTNPAHIMWEINEGEYTPEQFDEYAYCISEEEYKEEQSGMADL